MEQPNESELMLPIGQLLELQGESDGTESYLEYTFDVAGLIRLVTNASGISPFIKTRRAEAIYVRMVVMYRLHKEGLTLTAIGRILHKHHATVIYNINCMSFALEHPNLYPFAIMLWNKVIKEYPL